MKHPLSHRDKNFLSAFLLLPAMFALGLWLGALIIPDVLAPALFRINAVAAALMPHGGGISFTEDGLTGALLSAAGVPQAAQAANYTVNIPDPDQQAPVISPQDELVVAGSADSGESILVISAAALEERRQASAAAQASAEPSTEKDEAKPQVIIYSTHASEEYAGQTRITGEAGGVIAVGRAMADKFEELGIGTVFVDTLHDSPSYNEAYARSLETVTALAQQYPDIEVYIDVHRDSALAGVSTTLNSNDTSYAKMLLIVGTNEQLEHPNWEQNYSFAQSVTAACNELVEGIMREPRLYSWRYNQHIASKAILVEIGSTDNSEEEAKRSAEVLAQAIANCL